MGVIARSVTDRGLLWSAWRPASRALHETATVGAPETLLATPPPSKESIRNRKPNASRCDRVF